MHNRPRTQSSGGQPLRCRPWTMRVRPCSRRHTAKSASGIVLWRETEAGCYWRRPDQRIPRLADCPGPQGQRIRNQRLR
jgi:hypothetical protein